MSRINNTIDDLERAAANEWTELNDKWETQEEYILWRRRCIRIASELRIKIDRLVQDAEEDLLVGL